MGAGYQFTHVDSGIGLVVLPSLIGGERDVYYKNYNKDNDLTWDWQELNILIEELYLAKYSSASSVSNANLTITVPLGVVPEGLGSIVAWVNKYVKVEIVQRCPIDNTEVNPVNNSTNSTNVTEPVVIPVPVVNQTNSTSPVDNNTIPVDNNSTLDENSTVSQNSTSVSNETSNNTSPINNSTDVTLPEANSTISSGNGTLASNDTSNNT